MAVTFILSFLLVLAASESCILMSGGTGFYMTNPSLLLGIAFILILMIYLSGNGKSFLLLFSAKLKNADLNDLKKADNALSYAIKTLPFICAFFMLTSVIYFYLNYFEIQTLGFNLTAVLNSIRYLAQAELILLTLRGKLKKQIISYMDEDSELSAETAVSDNQVSKAATIIKTVLSVAVIIALSAAVILSNTVNNSTVEPMRFWNLADIPSFIFTFVPSFILLTLSGNFILFFKSLAAVAKNNRLTVNRKALYTNASETLRYVIFFEGIMSTLCGLIGILFNAEDKYALGKNFTIACIPLMYALFTNLILLPVEGKLHHLPDGD